MRQLKLAEDSTVVQFPEKSRFTEAWALREGAMRTRGEGADRTKKLWDREAKRVGGQAVLLEAFKRFLKGKPEKDGYTHCGLSVWLNQQRCDHWISSGPLAPQTGTASRVLSPEPCRSRMVEASGESWVVSYLDPCTFHEDGFITPRTSYAKEKLMEQRHALKQAGIAGIRAKE